MNKTFGGWKTKWWPEGQTPVGIKCLWCEEQIVRGDDGLDMDGSVFHRECFIRSLFGSVGHQEGKCSCYGGSEEDPVGMTKRQAALAATELMRKNYLTQ